MTPKMRAAKSTAGSGMAGRLLRSRGGGGFFGISQWSFVGVHVDGEPENRGVSLVSPCRCNQPWICVSPLLISARNRVAGHFPAAVGNGNQATEAIGYWWGSVIIAG